MVAAAALVLGSAAAANASDVSESIVDATAPTGTVTLAPGSGSAPITITLTVTGTQAGTATFDVNRDYTLSGGTFTGANPQTFTVPPRAARDAATTYTATGSVLVTSGQAPGTFTLAVAPFNITNTNNTTAKLNPGGASSYQVVVSAPADTTAPVLDLPDSFTREATSTAGAPVTYTASATDAVDGVRPVTCSPTSGSTFAFGTTTVNCSSSDTHGNTATGSFTVTVQDSIAPAVTVPANMTEEATGPAGAGVTFGASATDAIDGAVATTCDPASGSTFALGTAAVTCSATDAHGNTGQGSFTVTVRDTNGPQLTLPADILAEATGPAGAVATFSATAHDAVDGDVLATCTPASGSTFALGSTEVSCSASDSAGNPSSGSFRVVVGDTTAPALDLPADMVEEATGPSGAPATFTATASDLVDGAVGATCTPASASTFPIGVTTVECSASDNAGNSASGSFTVTVGDTTAPDLTVPASKTVEATGPSGAAVEFTGPSATDLVDGTVSATCDRASGSTFPIGATAVHCTATDAHDNTATGTFTVTVQDTTAPALGLPGNLTREATGPGGAAVTYAVTAQDLVDGPVPAACTPASGGTFPLGSTTVHCSASDAAGNGASGSFTITVVDTTPPTVTVPADIAALATSASGAAVTFSANASDLVDGPVTPTCTPAPGSTFALGATTVSCSATDAHGNQSPYATFTVTVTASWSGFLQPINSDGSSVFKQGSTVPVKFALTGVSAGIGNLAAHLYVASISGTVVGTDTEAVSTSAADSGNTFRYDAVAKQYIFNLSTKTLASGTYQLRADLGDGVSHTVRISLKK